MTKRGKWAPKRAESGWICRRRLRGFLEGSWRVVAPRWCMTAKGWTAVVQFGRANSRLRPVAAIDDAWEADDHGNARNGAMRKLTDHLMTRAKECFSTDNFTLLDVDNLNGNV